VGPALISRPEKVKQRERTHTGCEGNAPIFLISPLRVKYRERTHPGGRHLPRPPSHQGLSPQHGFCFFGFSFFVKTLKNLTKNSKGPQPPTIPMLLQLSPRKRTHVICIAKQLDGVCEWSSDVGIACCPSLPPSCWRGGVLCSCRHEPTAVARQEGVCSSAACHEGRLPSFVVLSRAARTDPQRG
jgi:hypothetical protein